MQLARVWSVETVHVLLEQANGGVAGNVILVA